MNLTNIAKTASFLALAGGMVKPVAKLLGFHALWNSALPAAVDAAGGQGSFKSKVGQGFRQFTKSFFNPGNLVGNMAAYNLAPALGAKAIGTLGKGMQAINPTSGVGKFLTGMEKGQGNSMFSNYILGQKAGFVPSMAIGSTIGQNLGESLTGATQNSQMSQLMRNQGRLPLQ